MFLYAYTCLFHINMCPTISFTYFIYFCPFLTVMENSFFRTINLQFEVYFQPGSAFYSISKHKKEYMSAEVCDSTNSPNKNRSFAQIPPLLNAIQKRQQNRLQAEMNQCSRPSSSLSRSNFKLKYADNVVILR